MTDQTMTCEQFENRLADYLEGDVTDAERIALDAHVDSCEQCGALVRDLRSITAAAAALPPIQPPAHVWEGIRARIGADVVSIDSRRRRWMPILRGLAAAVLLVVASSSVTYMMTRQDGATGGAAIASNEAPIAEPADERLPEDIDPAESETGSDVEAPSGRRDIAVGVGDAPFPNITPAPEDRAPLRVGSTTYEDEISKLRGVLRSRNTDLDRKTVKTIERSLAVIDTAIAQARSALAKDPGSQFLTKELTDALDKKVRLLRTAAMLPSKT